MGLIPPFCTMSHFYPRPPRGGRRVCAGEIQLLFEFLSTPSARRATSFFHVLDCSLVNFYPRPPRGGRLAMGIDIIKNWRISIHALREEGDSILHRSGRLQSDFYPRPPRGGRLPQLTAFRSLFHFYPRPPRGGRHPSAQFINAGEGFLSTPSARRATASWPAFTALDVTFLSTPSARRATAKTETKSLFSNKLYNILHEFRRALIYNGSKNYPNHAK